MLSVAQKMQLFKSRKTEQVAAGFYPAYLSSSERSSLDSERSVYAANGGVPDLLYIGKYSIDTSTTSNNVYNLIADSDNGTTINTDSAGIVASDSNAGTVFDFDSGSTEHIDTSFSFTEDNDFTINVWSKRLGGPGNAVIFSAGTAGGWEFQYAASNTEMRLNRDGTSNIANVSEGTVSSAWNMWSLRWNATTTTWEIFENGVSLGSGVYATAITNGNLRIAGDVSGADKFNGRIGQISYNSAALTDSQILSIYNAQKSNYGIS